MNDGEVILALTAVGVIGFVGWHAIDAIATIGKARVEALARIKLAEKEPACEPAGEPPAASDAAEAALEQAKAENVAVRANYIKLRETVFDMFRHMRTWHEQITAVDGRHLATSEAAAEPRVLVQLINTETGTYTWVRPHGKRVHEADMLDGWDINVATRDADFAAICESWREALGLTTGDDFSPEALGDVLGTFEPCDKLYVVRY